MWKQYIERPDASRSWSLACASVREGPLSGEGVAYASGAANTDYAQALWGGCERSC
jgi:hypothetical protein